MKKYLLMVAVIVIAVVLLANCHSTKKTTTTTPETAAAKVTYESSIQTLVSNNCSPCHFPTKGGNKKPFDTYEATKANIDSMLYRIQLNPTDKGFMPFKRPKLSDSTIAVFKEWRDAGTPQ